MRFLSVLFLSLATLWATPASAQQQLLVPSNRPPAPSTTDKENLWILDLSTGGRVTIWLRSDVAPKHVERIKTLTRQKFYDGLVFHRVIDGFMAQGGDPKGDGTGGSELPDLEKEFNYLPHVRGAVSAARPGAPQGAPAEIVAKAENGANSQFFIMLAPRLSLDRDYTVFGRVLEGMQYVDSIPRGEPPAQPARIVHAWIAADNPPPYQADQTKAAVPNEDADLVIPPAGN
ncbi:peptidylprolyl isomerase [Sphingomonas sp. BGYR3]|uniref:peptidylprolyl isomerase n=1 Tax=Sphingomonas sp. BGYR3 TaxID=2975483 RepID=UPI0021A81ED8|nr:peptidylprolyl isomerase [Sphingomonas sp. BGYR3]MDG5488030.1 peptidylprolyl isomerase [Sphingomonas sp. BGYR3]